MQIGHGDTGPCAGVLRVLLQHTFEEIARTLKIGNGGFVEVVDTFPIEVFDLRVNLAAAGQGHALRGSKPRVDAGGGLILRNQGRP